MKLLSELFALTYAAPGERAEAAGAVGNAISELIDERIKAALQPVAAPQPQPMADGTLDTFSASYRQENQAAADRQTEGRRPQGAQQSGLPDSLYGIHPWYETYDSRRAAAPMYICDAVHHKDNPTPCRHCQPLVAKCQHNPLEPYTTIQWLQDDKKRSIVRCSNCGKKGK